MDPYTYVSTSNVQRNWVLLMIKEFAEKLKKISGKCMDIGCGPGNVTRNILLPSLGPDATILGTDISEKMIKYANKTYANEQSVKFEVLNIETKNLPEKYISDFDHLFSFQTLHWCQNFRKACENMHRMLRPGGTILILFLTNQDALEECFKIVKQDVSWIQYDRAYMSPFYSSIRPNEELKDLLEDVGFTVYYCSVREVMLSAKDMENLQSSLFSLFDDLNKKSPNEQEKFKENFKRIYEEERVKRYNEQSRFHHNKQETDIIDMQKVLVTYAQKNL